MAVILLVVIYIVFIGLGIPDSALGPAWPAIYADLSISVSAGGLITIILALGTIVSSLLTPKLVPLLGTGGLTAVSTGLTAAGLLWFSVAGDLTTLCMASIPLGLGAGAIDTALNSYIAANYSAAQMSFLHCFYGVGVMISPMLLGLVMSGSGSWRSGYMLLFWIQAVITAVSAAALPLWKRVPDRLSVEKKGRGGPSLRAAIRDPHVQLSCIVFFATCAIEFTCGVWGSTYLVLEKGMDMAVAASMLTLYYGGIAAGRFLSGVLVGKLGPRKVLYLGEALTAGAICALFLPLTGWLAAAVLFAIGLGNGPVYPNMMFLTPENFGLDLTPAAMSAQIASSYVSNMAVPTVFGMAAERVGFWLLPGFLAFWAALLVFATWKLGRRRPRMAQIA